MNIKRAKQEIKNTIQAYLAKDEVGEYVIPRIRQRPILLMGPPGIGKTQIMEQIARECRIGLVAYTITHHTRQSAIGLPFIKEKEYDGQLFSVTEYTMSEIIASVYDKMKQTRFKEGILFIDEINCVSETLAPTMLQFLQGKTFGNQQVPKGWIIVAAGNPPEYNKSVREFDVVTLDRIKKIEVEENFDVWKEYAYRQGIHPAIISYLELCKDHFYKVETTVDGKLFATARGWEDLSQLLQVYEQIGLIVDREVVSQYIQHRLIAKHFANYLELYYKYREDYSIDDIVHGQWNTAMIQKIKQAPFDEHLGLIGLLNGKLGEMFEACYVLDEYVTKLHHYLVYYRDHLGRKMLEDVRLLALKDMESARDKELLTHREEKTFKQVIDTLEEFCKEIRGESPLGQEAFARVKELFEVEDSVRTAKIEYTSRMLQHVFHFMEDAFGESQEMVALVTELNANYYSVWFIDENGCDLYYRYNKGLLFGKRQEEILREMTRLEAVFD